MKKLNTTPRGFDLDYIKGLEEKHNATFIIEIGDPSMRGDVTAPMAVFYAKDAHPQGSNYFGITFNYSLDCFFIRDALPFLPKFVDAIKFADGLYYHSSYRHDYMKDEHSDARIDGGQDYLRASRLSKVRMFSISDLVAEAIK